MYLYCEIYTSSYFRQFNIMYKQLTRVTYELAMQNLLDCKIYDDVLDDDFLDLEHTTFSYTIVT
jgi:hypothetical protein